MAQYALPTSDNTNQFYTQGAGDGDGSYFDELDEGFGAGRGTGSGPDDATTYWTNLSSDGNGILITNGNAITDPSVNTGHIGRARHRKSATSGKQLDFTIHVTNAGLTPIASATATAFDTTTWTTHSVTLTSGNVDTFRADGRYASPIVYSQSAWVGGGASRSAHVSAQEFECPEAAGGGRTTKNTRSWPLGTEIGMGHRMECAA
jgi:hypothetical protein